MSTHHVNYVEVQPLVVTANGNVAYDLVTVQYRCSCGWHTDKIDLACSTQALRDAVRKLAHAHAITGAS